MTTDQTKEQLHKLPPVVINGALWLRGEDSQILQDVLLESIKIYTNHIHSSVNNGDPDKLVKAREHRKRAFELIEMLDGTTYPLHDPTACHRLIYTDRIELYGAQLPVKYIETIRDAVTLIAALPMADRIFAWVQTLNGAFV